MPSILKTLRAAADPTRLRILLLLKEEELSVAELQEILTLGQSTISTHLAQLKQAELVEDRRTGKSSLYRLLPGAGNGLVTELLAQAEKETPETTADRAAMRRVLRRRQERMRTFFDSMAGRLGKDYVPGKSWKSLVVALLRLMPQMIIADLGAGDGSFALLLSQSATQVFAIDSSEKMLEVGREQAQRHNVPNIEFRQGDMEDLPLTAASVDLVFFSQSLHHALHPARALAEAHRILRPGGRVVILDLAKHRFEEARELYADEWLGFGEADLEDMLTKAGFAEPYVAVVDRDLDAPQFQTLLGIAIRTA
jgi:ubiquinone/menaquinone biosynthesis C-methylase UbiE